MDAKIFRVNYKSDFILTLTSDAGWMTPFCIKFWTGSPMLAYYASYDGETYTHCTYDPSDPTKLTVQFDDHHLPIGDLKYQVAYHFTVADFPENTEDEVTNQANVTTVIDGETYQVMLDLNGETAPEIQFALPAYANELQRIQNEQTRIAQEQQRIAQEQTRINQEAARVTEFNGIVNTANNDHQRANEDHSRALSDHQNALDDRSQAASDHSRAQSDHNTATSDHLQANSDHSRAQSDHNTAISNHQTALSDHTQANYDHTRAESDHSRATSDSSTAANDHRIAADDHTQANTDHNRAENDHQRVETDLAAVEEFSNSLGPYDISAAHATGSTLATYPDLATALGTNGTNIPEALRKGGMSVKFVQSFDNNSTQYVQYRLMADEFSTAVADWQGVDAEPVAGSKNLVESGGVEKSLIYNNHTYTKTQKQTARENIGLFNITEVESSQAEDDTLKIIDETSNKTLVNIHKSQDNIKDDFVVCDNEDNEVCKIDKDGVHAKKLYYGANDKDIEDTISELEERIDGNVSRNVALIMFMGQSNMAGRGVVNSAHPQDAPQVIDGAGYEFRAISDPTKLYPITKTFGNTEDNPNGIDDNGRKTGGPVPSFVNAFYKTCHTTVIGVSASRGGSSITAWQPNTSYLNDAISRLQSAVSYLENNNYNIVAKYVLWCQGEKDGDTGMSQSDYANYFNATANALFSAGIEKMFIMRIGKYNGTDPISYDDIINEQNVLCKGNENYIMATTVLASLKDKGLMKDQFHYYQEGYNIAGNYSGYHTANYLLYSKSDAMYDVMTNTLYFDNKTY